MTPDEFWGATLAQVTELYRVQILTWARNRDYFVAELCAISMNSHRTETSQKVWDTDDFLNSCYPQKPKTVIITPGLDPDRGAQCNWSDLRESIKARDTARKQRQRRK